jgi:CAAX prenyl protease-like protein
VDAPEAKASDHRTPSVEHPASVLRDLNARHPWLPFLLPFIVYMAASMFEPSQPKGREGVAPIDAPNSLGIRYAHYPIVYTAKLVLTVAAMIVVLPGYRQFPFRISLLAVGVGIAGSVLWIAICGLRLEQHLVDWLGPDSRIIGLLGLGERPAYNPLDQLAHSPVWAYTFLAIRFIGLVLIVPIIEEFFLRGFLMRYIMGPNWWQIPFGQVNSAAIALGTLFPVLYHPEKLAALAWFSLVTWLMIRTRNIWDCVAAHAITNLALGLYVVTQGEWRLW